MKLSKKSPFLSPSSVRAILALVPLLAVLSLVFWFIGKPHFSATSLELADALHEPEQHHGGSEPAPDISSVEYFMFDPNTVTFEELVALGLERGTAAGVIKYRERGKVFSIPEDFATCYGLSMEQYSRLKPYIRISAQHTGSSTPESRRDHKRNEPQQHVSAHGIPDFSSLRPFDPNQLGQEGFTALGFSPAQSRTIINFRESIGGFANASDLQRCYVVSDQMYQVLEPFIVIETASTQQQEVSPQPGNPKIELNTADSTTLVSVRGIGALTASRIIEYRKLLGGFFHNGQLAEIRGMTEANYLLIIEQIWIDTCGIQKIDINFADHKTLAERLGEHPYMNRQLLRKLLKERQLKGGWSTITELVEDKILNSEEAEKLAPYFIFR